MYMVEGSKQKTNKNFDFEGVPDWKDKVRRVSPNSRESESKYIFYWQRKLRRRRKGGGGGNVEEILEKYHKRSKIETNVRTRMKTIVAASIP